MIGQKFGRWTVLEEGEAARPPCGVRKRRMLCRCDCGTVRIVRVDCLRRGRCRSCGCLKKERARNRGNSHSIRTIVDGFLGWTTEYLNFVPVGDTYALVDEDDFLKLNRISWHLQSTSSGIYYAATALKSGKQRHNANMHQMVLPLPKGLQVDHKNRNGLDNRRDNLRAASPSQNHANQRTQKTNKWHSRFKGVTQRRNGWRAAIKINSKTKYLGDYRNEIDAARAYDEAALEYFGEFARTNLADGNLR